MVRSQLEYSCGDVCEEAGKPTVEGSQNGQESRTQVSLN